MGSDMSVFQVIQGGMGVGVSNWRLARAVSLAGQLGVVSGTGLALLLARRLQNGDPDGQMRRGLAAFPFPRIAESIVQRYYIPGGLADGKPYILSPMPHVQCAASLVELTVAANFVEVFLAKEGHSGVVGINFLEKIQTPTLPSIYGAMLANADYILMGAGIPRMIPGVLDAFAQGLPAELRLDVAGSAPGEVFHSRFAPAEFLGQTPPTLRRPHFLAIVSSATLAVTLSRKSNGRVDGFIVELPVAGGHNAPPRGQVTLNARGEPIYGERDEPDMQRIADIGLPFYLAGGYASPQGLARARAQGASGIQVGTLFAFCEESGIDPELRTKAHALVRENAASVFTDPMASPTGFPFKVLEMPGTLSDPAVYAARKRVCDLGYLRSAYRRDDGTVGFRCPAEPPADYVKKGGDIADTVGRKCLCNGLFGTLGMGGFAADGSVEPAIMTSGDDIVRLPEVFRWMAQTTGKHPDMYSAADVLGYLLSPPAAASPAQQLETSRASG